MNRSELEKNVLGAILLNPDESECALNLPVEAFGLSRNREIFSAMKELAGKGEPISELSLPEAFADDLFKLSEDVISCAHVRSHTKMLLDLRAKENALHELRRIASIKPTDMKYTVKDISDEIDKVSKLLIPRLSDKGLVHISETGPNVLKTLIDVKNNKFPGIRTGFYDIDRYDLILKNKCLVLLMAKPKVGKTSLAWNIAVRSKVNVLFFSHEMSANQLYFRQLSNETKISNNSFYDKSVVDSMETKIAEAAQKINELPIWIDDTRARTVNDIKTQCAKFAEKRDIGLVIVDYLQLVKFPEQLPIRERVGIVAERLCILAQEFDVPVLAISSMRRTMGDQKAPPSMHDLKESGDLEYTADIVLGLHRPALYDNALPATKAELYVLANRNGRVGKIYLGYDPETTTFGDYVLEKQKFNHKDWSV